MTDEPNNPTTAQTLADAEIQMAREAVETLREEVRLREMMNEAHETGRAVWRSGSSDRTASEVFEAAAAYREFHPSKWWRPDEGR